jgi:hypothetical protein
MRYMDGKLGIAMTNGEIETELRKDCEAQQPASPHPS